MQLSGWSWPAAKLSHYNRFSHKPCSGSATHCVSLSRRISNSTITVVICFSRLALTICACCPALWVSPALCSQLLLVVAYCSSQQLLSILLWLRFFCFFFFVCCSRVCTVLYKRHALRLPHLPAFLLIMLLFFVLCPITALLSFLLISHRRQ